MKTIGDLYLAGRKNEDNSDEFEVSIETMICLFVLVYCDIEIDIYIVDTQDIYPNTVPLSGLEKLKKHFEISIVNKRIYDCCFPAVKVSEDKICISGVCAVLRWIIKLYVEKHPNHHSKNLLGFRGGCLVACTESSIWTKFCELQLPDAVKEVAAYTRGGSVMQEIPKNLSILEAHLSQPVRTHNILKRKLDIAKKAMETNSSSTARDDDGTPNNVAVADLPFSIHENNVKNTDDIVEQLKSITITEKSENFCLNHCYLEGIDLTLADMVVFPCVHYLLCKLPPQANQILKNVSKWYKNMMTNIRVKTAARKCHCCTDLSENIHTVSSDNQDISLPEVEQISLYTRDTFHPRLRSKKYNPAGILSILEVASIHPLFGEKLNNKVEWNELPSVLHPANGDLPEKRVARKRQQLESMVTATLGIAKDGQTIVEFCAGGGHVGLLLAYYLPNCKIVLVENKESSMIRARSRAKALELKNISFFQCNMDYFKGLFDIGISLHACGVATDLVIQQCISQQSAFVCCPCCYGGLQNTHLLNYPLSKRFQSSGLSNQGYTKLAHCADRNEVNTPTAKQGEHCMGLIDMDRVYNGEENGYSVALTTLQPPSCSPKHNLLIGKPLSWNKILTS